MKKLALLFTLTLMLSACGSKKQEESKVNETVYMEVPDFMKISQENIGKEIKVKGTVTHVCSHSGRRCFIVDPSGEQTLKIEASGDIKSFGRELSGTDIQVTGIVRETRLETEYLNEWETKVKEDVENIENDGEQCASELSNIQEMRDWMKANNKDYYSIIYLDGLSYETINEKAEI